MKRIVGFFLALLLLLSVTACDAQKIRVPAYDPTVEEANHSVIDIAYQSFDDAVMHCSAIIKAVYLGESEPVTMHSRAFYKFRVEEDFTGLAEEEIIRVHDSTDTVFVPGKSYYLFMQGARLSLLPFAIYNRVGGIMIGEVPAKYSETGEAYYTGIPDAWKDVKDLSSYIRSEVIEKQRYYVDDPQYTHESFEDAYRNADVVTLVTVTKVEPGVTLYNWGCDVEIVEELKGEYYHAKIDFDEFTDEELKEMGWTRGVQPESRIQTSVWEKTEVGDQLVLLYKHGPGKTMLDLYSLENHLFKADSPEGQWIIETAHAEKAE